MTPYFAPTNNHWCRQFFLRIGIPLIYESAIDFPFGKTFNNDILIHLPNYSWNQAFDHAHKLILRLQ